MTGGNNSRHLATSGDTRGVRLKKDSNSIKQSGTKKIQVIYHVK